MKKLTVHIPSHPWGLQFNNGAIVKVSGYYQPVEPPSDFDHTGKPLYPGCEEDFDTTDAEIYIPCTSSSIDIMPLLSTEAIDALDESVLEFLQEQRDLRQ